VTTKPSIIPGLLAQSVAEALLDFQRRQNDLADELRNLYKPLIKDFRRELQETFLSYFSYNVPKDAEQPVWEPAIARKKVVPLILKSYNSMVDAAGEEAASLMDDSLDLAYVQSYNRHLWILDQSGIPVIDDEGAGSSLTRRALLIAGGIAGLSYLDRLRRASSVSKSFFSKVLKASISQASTLTDTLDGLEKVTRTMVQRIVSLGNNESKRAYLLAGEVVRSKYEVNLMGEVWISRGDSRVCLVCATLHLTITSLAPIDDSHPGCRCVKVPIAMNYQGQPIDFVGFLEKMGMR